VRIMNHRTHITAGTENGASPNQSKSNILPGPIFGGQVNRKRGCPRQYGAPMAYRL